MNKKCTGCGAILQTEKNNKEGYIKKEIYDKAHYCERCFKIIHYGGCSVIEKQVEIIDFLKQIKNTIPVIYLLDLTCISNITLEPLKQIKNKVYLLLTKKDLLPKSVKDKKIISYIKENYLNINDIYVISSKKMWNIDFIYNKLIKDKIKECYVLGHTNSGKSSLINSLLKSIGEKAIITTSSVPNTTTELININLENKITIIDTPGFVNRFSISNFMSIKEYKTLIPKKEIKPKIYHLKPGFMILIENILRIENNTEEIIDLIFYLKNELKYEKMKNKTSDKLKILEKINIKTENEDIVIEGLGFIKVQNKAELTIYTLDKQIISKRTKMI